MMKLEPGILEAYIQDPTSVDKCLALAENYMNLKQYSSAVTYYLKCLELCKETSYAIKYHCLLSLCIAYRILGNRPIGCLQYARFAKSECPDRPEAYFILGCILSELQYKHNNYEQGEWIQVYENAKIGSLYTKVNDQPLSRYYPGKESLYALYAISMLRLGKIAELDEFLNEYTFTERDNPYVMSTINYIYGLLNKKSPYIL